MDKLALNLFKLLNDDLNTVTNPELDKAYEEFIEEITVYYRSENDYITIIRTLNFTRIEFKALQTLSQYGQGKNAIKNLHLQKAIWYLESEIDLLKLNLSQVNPLFNNTTETNNSKVYFIPNPKEGLGIDSMGEFATTFELSCQFVDEEGKPAPFIHIAHSLENAFNFSFGNTYKSKSRMFSRKPYNLAKALDYLKNLIIKASRNNKMKKDNFI